MKKSVPACAGTPIPINGKQHYRTFPGTVPLNTNELQFMFVAVPNSNGGGGVVDVIEIGAAGTPRKDTNAYETGIQSIPVANVAILTDFFRE